MNKPSHNNIEQITIWDNLSGKQLDTKLVGNSREEEMEEVRKHSVYLKVPNKPMLARNKSRAYWNEMGRHK